MVRWKGPTVREIAELARVGPATVDRVLNARQGVSPRTRDRVLGAFRKLSASSEDGPHLRIRLFCESGGTFNNAMSDAVASVNRDQPNVEISDHYSQTIESDPQKLSKIMLETSIRSNGVILVAREHPAINLAVRKLRKEGVPVVCLTTDLPSSRRSTYIGNDQYAAGSVAAQLIGQALTEAEHKILLVMSVAFRCQREREMGFRRVLRSAFPHLRVDEKVVSNDMPDSTYDLLRRHIDSNGCPSAIYNVAGANRGVARAIEGETEKPIFVGHELTPVSRILLQSGAMDYVISHDFAEEVLLAVKWIREQRLDVTSNPSLTPILLHTRYNCSD